MELPQLVSNSSNIYILQFFSGFGKALLEAMTRIERYRAFGNENGMRVWQRIADAIEFMQIPGKLTRETVQ